MYSQSDGEFHKNKGYKGEYGLVKKYAREYKGKQQQKATVI